MQYSFHHLNIFHIYPLLTVVIATALDIICCLGGYCNCILSGPIHLHESFSRYFPSLASGVVPSKHKYNS